MKVYVVTTGDFDDYRIEKIFTTREAARIYALINFGAYDFAEVEEYDVEEETITELKEHMRVEYNFSEGRIISVTFSDSYSDEVAVDLVSANVVFYVHTADKKLYDSIIGSGMDSDMLLRIAGDRLAQWQCENGLSDKELHDAHDKAWEEDYQKRWGFDAMDKMNKTLLIATTSSATGPVCIGELLKEALDKCIINGDPLPDETELQKMADEIRNAGCDEQ